MFGSQELQQQIHQAIEASENIINSLQRGNIEEADKYEGMRAACVRALSKCQNFETMALPYKEELVKLAELDKTILKFSEKLRDEVLTDIRKKQSNRLSRTQYAENQGL